MRTRLTTEAQLEQFIAEAQEKIKTITFNRWLEDDQTLRIYVRRSTRFTNDTWSTFIDLANIIANPMGQGRFTKFLEHVERLQPFDGVFIESVLNRRLAKFFSKREGYARRNAVDPYQTDFYRLWNK